MNRTCTRTRVVANNNRTMNYKRRTMRKRSMHRKLTIIFGIAIFLVLVFLGTSVVTANAKTEQRQIQTEEKCDEDNRDENYGKDKKRYKYYTTVYVTRDMTLWDIAEEYITDEYSDKRAYIDEVMEINQLKSDKLSYGSTICVPYYSVEYK